MAVQHNSLFSRHLSMEPGQGKPAWYRRRRGFLLLCWCCLLGALTPPVSHGYPVPPSDESHVQAGMFLVAKPSLRDPLFQHTVILITAHDDHGTIGLIINHPTKLRLNDALPKDRAVSSGNERLYVGGPVHPNSLFSLIQSAEPLKGQQPVVGKIYFMAGLDALKDILAKHHPGVATRSYVGYSGWSAGQLETEIERGDWLVIRADTQAIFKHDTNDLWHNLIKNHLGRWL